MTYEEMLAQVQEDPNSISEIENPTEELQLIAVECEPTSIYSIDNPSPKAIIKAIELNHNLACLITELEGFITEEVVGFVKSLIDFNDDNDELWYWYKEYINNLVVDYENEEVSIMDGLAFSETVYNSIDETVYYFLRKGLCLDNSDHSFNFLFRFKFFQFKTLKEAIEYCERTGRWQFEDDSVSVFEVAKFPKNLSDKPAGYVEYIEGYCSDEVYRHGEWGDYGLLLPGVLDVEPIGDGGHNDYCLFRYEDDLYIVVYKDYE